MYSEQPIVSIVIPVYNTETFLRRCLDSACEQTLKNIEIIIVNDGSTDGSADICTEFSLKDSRIKVITHDKNMGLLQARISGVAIASGIYVHFVDSDDFIALDCEEKIWADSHASYDIIGFNAVFFSSQSAEIDPLYEARINRSEELTFLGSQIFEDFFCRFNHSSCVWAKWFRSELAKKVVALIPHDYYYMSEDFYFCTVASFLAESERHVPLRVYHYNVGSGISNQYSFAGLDQFNPVFSMLKVLRNIKQFLINQDSFEKYAINFKYWEDEHIESLLFRFGKITHSQDKKKALELIFSQYDHAVIAKHLCRAYFRREREIADLLYGSPIMTGPNRKIKTLGVFYYRINNGGVERVLSRLIPLYVQLGYKVVLFTDYSPCKEDYKLPDGIERVVFSNPICDISLAKICDRQQEWREAIKKYNIDAVIYNAHVEPRILWELITIKLEKVKFLVASHGLSSYLLHIPYNQWIDFPSYYRLADAMTCLSRIDELWWRGCGINCRYVPNPISFTQIPAQQVDIGDSKNILWIGRISEEKQPIDAIKAFACAIKLVPDAKLIVVGVAESWDKQNEIMKQTAKELGVADKVVFAGFSKNVEQFFHDTAIHIFTSKFEGFGMVLIEVKLYGIPTVSYNLPYIEPLRCTKGNVIVQQGDFHAMGNAMAHLLKNQQYRKALGAEGQESIKYFINYPLSETWDEIIRLAGNGENFLLPESAPFEDVRIMSETLHKGIESFHALNYSMLSELKEKNSELAQLVDREVKYYQNECRNNHRRLAEQQELLNHRLLRAAAKIDKLSKRFFPNNGGIRKVAKVGWDILRWEYQILRKCLKLNKC